MKGRDPQKDFVEAYTAKHQNTPSEITDKTNTTRDTKEKKQYQIRHKHVSLTLVTALY